MNQPTLFDLPRTSHAAYSEAKKGLIENHQGKILQALKSLKSANYETIAGKAGLEKHKIGRRLSELERMEKVYKPGTTSPTSAGRMAFNYSLVKIQL